MNIHIKILPDYTLEMSKKVAFKDLLDFINSESFPDIWDFFQSHIIAQIVDVNPNNRNIAKKFNELLKEGSDQKVFNFYVKNKLYDSEHKEADDNLKLWYHVKFLYINY